MKKHLLSKLGVILIIMYFVSPAWGAGTTFNLNIYRPISGQVFEHDNNAPADEIIRGKIEEIIGFWADAIFEASNGADRLGTIRIYQQTRPQSNIEGRGPMHVLWRPAGTPFVWMDDGHKFDFSDPDNSMGHINMYDRLPRDEFVPGTRDNNRPGVNNFFTDPVYQVGSNSPFPSGGLVLAGYALAHESGHYIYGLFDEYYREATGWDDLGHASIMNRQGDALIHNNPQALNFSTRRHYFYYPDGTQRLIAPRTEQFLRTSPYGIIGAWDHILSIRPYLQPYFAKIEQARENGEGNGFFVHSGVTPGVPDEREGYARRDLEITWADGRMFGLIMEMSGRGAEGNYNLNHMVRAGQMFVSGLRRGEAVTMAAFDHLVRDTPDPAFPPHFPQHIRRPAPFPMTELRAADSIEANRTNMLNWFNQLNDRRGGAALYHAIETMARTIVFAPIFSRPSSPRAGYLIILADGPDLGSGLPANARRTEQQAIELSQRLGIRLIGVGVGPNAPNESLRRMAAATGGRAVFANNSRETPELLRSVMAELNHQEQVVSKRFSGVSENWSEIDFMVDPSMGSIYVEGTWQNPTEVQEVFIVQLVNPSGEIIPVNFDPSESRFSINIDNPLAGRWTVRVRTTSQQSPDISVLVFSSPSREVPRIEATWTLDHDNHIIEWGLRTGRQFYTNLNVSARVYFPDNVTVKDFILLDDGQNGDRVAGDGIYTLDLSDGVFQSGIYRVVIRANNSDLAAETTVVNGLGITPQKLGHDIERVSVITFHVQKIYPTEITLTPAYLDLNVGESVTLSVDILPENATERDITWTTSDDTIASVGNTGTVSGLNEGSAIITATSADGNVYAESVVTVQGTSNIISVLGVTIAPGSASITVGSTQQLTANVLPANATNRNVTWSSASQNVATVDENGLVTAVSPGTSVISVTTADGSFTAQATITVTNVIVNIPVESITVTPSTLSLNQGNQGSLSVAFTPANATNQAVIWSTSNSSVATVNNGTVTAQGAGSAVITATSVDGSRTSTSTITVTGGPICQDARRERYERRFPGRNIIFTPEGGGRVVGGPGNEVIVSGPGDNWLEGGVGNTIYVYNRDAEHDAIYNGQSVDGDINELHFGPGITLEDLTFYREGNDLLILVAENGEVTGSVRVINWYLANRFRLARIVFYDDTYLTTEEIEGLATRVIRGTERNETLRTLSQPNERVKVYANSGANSIFGGRAAETFVIGSGTDTIHVRSNLEGGGRKTFVWNVGAGNAAIHYLNAERQVSGDGLSILQFGPGVAPENIDTQVSGNDVIFVVNVGDTERRITIAGARLDIGRQMDEIRFADGTVWDWSTILNSMVIRGTTANQTLRTQSLPGEMVTVFSMGGVNSIFGGRAAETFVIGTGTDTIHVRSNLEGGGRKTFVWNVGAGNAAIHYLNAERQVSGDGLSILQFGPGVAPENIDTQVSGNDVIFVVTVGGVERRLTIVGARPNIGRQMDEIRFADGMAWSWYEIQNMMVVRGTHLNQTLRTNSFLGEMVTVFSSGGTNNVFGGHGTDTFVIGTGHDTIHARSNVEGVGRKAFVWNVGAGNATIHYLNTERQVSGDGLSILQFGPGVALENIDVQISGNNVIFVITVGGEERRITVANARHDIRAQMDEIRFSDGTVLTWNEMMERPRIIRGTERNETLRTLSLAGERVMVLPNSGANSIFGGHATEMFVIGTGTDTIHARSNVEGGGRKTFVWNIGAGNATIHYLNADRQTAGDRLSVMRFGPGVAPGNIAVQFAGNNVIFVVTAGGQERRLTFANARHDIRAQMDRIQFADRTSHAWSDFVGQ